MSQARDIKPKNTAKIKAIPKTIRDLDRINFIDLYNMYADKPYKQGEYDSQLSPDGLKKIFDFTRYHVSKH